MIKKPLQTLSDAEGEEGGIIPIPQNKATDK